jgi:hypothetical protein
VPDQAILTYTGDPALVSALAQALRQEGLDVDYERPSERRGAGEYADAIVELTVSGVAVNAITTGCRAAWRKFRERFPGGATVTSDDVELDDEDGMG